MTKKDFAKLIGVRVEHLPGLTALNASWNSGITDAAIAAVNRRGGNFNVKRNEV